LPSVVPRLALFPGEELLDFRFALVLDRGWAADALASGRIIALKADWTNPDPLIARYLASFGRYGIPFDAIYGPRAPQGIALPSLLSEAAIREAVAQAGGS
jgi:suppressor for copper-sensitivity B